MRRVSLDTSASEFFRPAGSRHHAWLLSHAPNRAWIFRGASPIRSRARAPRRPSSYPCARRAIPIRRRLRAGTTRSPGPRSRRAAWNSCRASRRPRRWDSLPRHAVARESAGHRTDCSTNREADRVDDERADCRARGRATRGARSGAYRMGTGRARDRRSGFAQR